MFSLSVSSKIKLVLNFFLLLWDIVIAKTVLDDSFNLTVKPLGVVFLGI